MLVCKNCGKVLQQCCDLYFPYADGSVLCGDCYSEKNGLVIEKTDHVEVVLEDLLEMDSFKDVIYEYVAMKVADNHNSMVHNAVISGAISNIASDHTYQYTRRKKLATAAAIILLELDRIDVESGDARIYLK